MPNELVTVPRMMAARVTRAVARIRKRQKPYGRKYLRRDRTGMKILFSPGTRVVHHLNRRRAPVRRARLSSRMVTPGRLELPTNSLGNCCSIHLSYGALVLTDWYGSSLEHFHKFCAWRGATQEPFGRMFYSHPSRPAGGLHTFQPGAADTPGRDGSSPGMSRLCDARLDKGCRSTVGREVVAPTAATAGNIAARVLA